MPPGVSLDQALQVLEIEARTILPKGFSIDYAGESRQLRTEGSRFLGIFLLSANLIFLVLAAQFESFRDPFVILAGSAPLAISGALIFSFLGFTTLNTYSQVGDPRGASSRVACGSRVTLSPAARGASAMRARTRG